MQVQVPIQEHPNTHKWGHNLLNKRDIVALQLCSGGCGHTCVVSTPYTKWTYTISIHVETCSVPPLDDTWGVNQPTSQKWQRKVWGIRRPGLTSNIQIGWNIWVCKTKTDKMKTSLSRRNRNGKQFNRKVKVIHKWSTERSLRGFRFIFLFLGANNTLSIGRVSYICGSLTFLPSEMLSTSRYVFSKTNCQIPKHCEKQQDHTSGPALRTNVRHYASTTRSVNTSITRIRLQELQ